MKSIGCQKYFSYTLIKTAVRLVYRINAQTSYQRISYKEDPPTNFNDCRSPAILLNVYFGDLKETNTITLFW
jgi:hypothetical protein